MASEAEPGQRRSVLEYAALGLAYVAPLMAVALTTVALYPLRLVVSNDLVALVYVLLLLLIVGLGPTLQLWWITPVAAVLVLDYFFTVPYFTFFVSSPHDIAMLGLFLTIGIMSSRQVRHLRMRTRQSEARLQDLRLLNALSEALVSSNTLEDIAQSLQDTLAGVGIGRVVMLAAETDQTGKGTLVPYGGGIDAREARAASWVMDENKAIGIPRADHDATFADPWPVSTDDGPDGGVPTHVAFVPLLSPRRPEGVLLVDAGIGGHNLIASESRLLVSAASLATSFLERRALQQQANAAALVVETDRVRSNLLSAVSHDIKTPLAAAKAHVTHLLVGDVLQSTAEQHDELTATVDSLDRLSGMVDDLIDLSRLESEGWLPSLEECEPGEIVSAVLAKVGPGSVRVRTDLTAAPAVLIVDFRQMERALLNLVNNALTYSAGEVRVVVARRQDHDVISVEDEGPGVPDEEKAAIFQKFVRGSASRAAPTGSGLGLAIASEVARSHGGALTVADVQPHGACFSMTLPATASHLHGS